MKINTINGSKDFIESLRGKTATFILSISTTKTCEIKGITQAGLPGLISLTPTLDAEFLAIGEVRSLENIAETPKGVPTPALITRAVHLEHPFKRIEFLNLGVDNIPKIDYFQIHNFDIKKSEAIDTNAKINALELFQKGVEFGKNYICKDDYIILGESVPSGTTTAEATAQAMGYDVAEKFSSSFKNNPTNIKNQTIKKALNNINNEDELFQILGKVSDNMLIFNAGFLLGNSYTRTKILLAGGTQMAALLLVVNSIVKYMDGQFDSSNIALCTTSWVANDEDSNIISILNMNDFKVNAYASNFNFSNSSHPALKLYEDGEAKEGVGAGGALIYASLNGIEQNQITNRVESLLG
ncbi:MAG: TIGR00303 family protein [Arcobacteraceae bacterium]|nr:TIGR00303 family protein [Arcobacteraceae bacterium]